MSINIIVAIAPFPLCSDPEKRCCRQERDTAQQWMILLVIGIAKVNEYGCLGRRTHDQIRLPAQLANGLDIYINDETIFWHRRYVHLLLIRMTNDIWVSVNMDVCTYVCLLCLDYQKRKNSTLRFCTDKVDCKSDFVRSGDWSPGNSL